MNKIASALTGPGAREVLDHLLLGIADLNSGIAWLEERTGVKAILGGSHPGAGTRNALASLGNQQYIEIISIDPAQQQVGIMAGLVKNLAAPRLIMWAAATTDIAAISKKAQVAGYNIEGPNAGSRVKPDGGALNWKTLNIVNDFGCLIPFFIEWGAGIVHPSDDCPKGCALQVLEMEHPEPDSAQKMLRELGVEASVKRGGKPLLRAVLKTPNGIVELS